MRDDLLIVILLLVYGVSSVSCTCLNTDKKSV